MAKASKKSVLKAKLELEGIGIREYRRAKGMAKGYDYEGSKPKERHTAGKRTRNKRRGSKRNRL
jgi:hypothetical protein